ncbi:MAG: Maf family protein [Planctomycetota bacterium]|jgi:septum formation protein|nr:Maf family protein [Planctomycetota bacterium]MDP6762532.1 Maf family protein [Planctomycetota bacterium]MDP6988105.1 Maf family protein [Planctomycetota bacterium]
MGPRLLLASASPRRRVLLERAGLTFTVEPSEVDETPPPGLEVEEVAVALAERKADHIAAAHSGAPVSVLGADTVVSLGETLLGKPRDEVDARRMLEGLSGSRHRVVTGVCVIDCAAGGERRSAFERTWVTMRPIAPEEIEAYVAGGEWRGKAGGYAIQESADAFVLGIEEGGLDNVVGLPVDLTLRLLAEIEKGREGRAGRLPG